MSCVWNNSPGRGILQGAYIIIEGSLSKLDLARESQSADGVFALEHPANYGIST